MTIPHFDDVIAALATAPGRGAVALLRVSGPRAAAVLREIAPELGADLPQPRVQRLLSVRHPSSTELLDRALVTWFPAPGSYTGEDTVEIACHGGLLTPQLILDAVLAAGARPALAGEFTRRALLNGKLDLLQAEAILDLVDGRSRALHRSAIHQMDRGLSHRIDALRSAILQVEALVIYDIDFPEEDEPPVSPGTVHAAATSAIRGIDSLLATATQGEMLREGALLVLAGEPNSGKSSLFNALLGSERAIVTELPGTTRDAIEATVEISGYPFRLVDTAGLRAAADPVEQIGIEVAHRYLAAADLVLFCIPAGRPVGSEELEFLERIGDDRRVLVRTMLDRVPSHLASAADGEVAVSAHTGTGLGNLADRLLDRAFGNLLEEQDASPLVTRERHARALRLAREQVEQFLSAAEDGVPMEIASTHLREAALALEALVGALTPDDVLGHLFAQFCVGK